MNDIRDLLSGRLHVERIVFSDIVEADSSEPQTSCYLGAASGERFLLIQLSAPEVAKGPIELAERNWIFARSSQADFVKRSNLPVIASRPRSQREPALDRAFQAMESRLRTCLRLGLHLVQQGTMRWDGDAFTADYFVAEGVKRSGIRIAGADGQEVPEQVKAKILADLKAKPSERKLKATLVRKEHKIFRSPAEAEAARAASEPAPGSIEAQIAALWEDKEKERLRKGIRGQLIRNEQNRVTEIVLQSEPACRVELVYQDPPTLPTPFPNRARTFLEHAEAKPGFPNSELIIHSVKLAQEPLPDEAFDPGRLLKPGSFVRAQLNADGGTFIPDAADRAFVNEWVRMRMG